MSVENLREFGIGWNGLESVIITISCYGWSCSRRHLQCMVAAHGFRHDAYDAHTASAIPAAKACGDTGASILGDNFCISSTSNESEEDCVR